MTIFSSHRTTGARRAPLVVLAALLPVFAVVGAASPPGAGTGVQTGDDTPKVTLCHATNADANPYVVITVDGSSVITQGHDGHTGPIWNPTLKDQKIDWGDVIPSFTYLEDEVTRTYPGMNTDALVLIANGCEFVTVQPVAPTVTPSTTCDVEGTYTIPATTGVTYQLDGTVIAAGTYTGPASGTITAVAKPGYLLSDPAWSFTLDLPAAAVCPTRVTPVNPTVALSPKCEVEGSYTIPASDGIAYQLDGIVMAAGTYPGPASGTITAQPLGDYTLSDPTWSFALDLPAAATCSQAVPVVVTPVAPKVTPSTICEVQGSFTIPTTTDVAYYLAGDPIKAGEYPGPASGLVTATAGEGYTLSDPTWSFALNVPAAEICAADAPTSDTPAADAPTAAEPTSALPKTGAPTSTLAAAGAVALMVGLALLVLGARRTRADLG